MDSVQTILWREYRRLMYDVEQSKRQLTEAADRVAHITDSIAHNEQVARELAEHAATTGLDLTARYKEQYAHHRTQTDGNMTQRTGNHND